MISSGLQGLRVLLTRPHVQNESLQARLTAAGARVRALPLLAIEPLPETPELRQQLMNLDLYQIVVVVSPNAARIALEQLDRYWPQLPVGIDWFTVGQGTARVLRDYGINAQAPAEGHDSEALLTLPRLQHVAGDRVLILRGEGGREMLAQTLQQQGARVEFAELYRRVIPDLPASELVDTFEGFQPQAVLLYSGSTFEHLMQLCQTQGVSLANCHLWVPSERVADKVREQGLEQVHVMQALDDEAIVQTLSKWHHRENEQ